MNGVIGIVGLGAMGAPMAARLAGAGATVVAYDRDAGRVTTAVQDGGCTAASCLEELGERADVVITMLPTSAVVREVLVDGDDRVLTPHARASVVVDMSSSVPADTVRLAEELRPRGIQVADAPVSGRRASAANGELTVMVGASNELFAQLVPLLEPVARVVHHVGPPGAGHAAKALNNLLSAIGLLAAAEVLVAGTRFGIEPVTLLQVLNAASGRNHATEIKYGPHVLSREFDSGFALDLMVKDVEIALGLMHELGVSHAIGDAAVALSRAAREGLGSGMDHTDAVRWIEQLGGAELR